MEMGELDNIPRLCTEMQLLEYPEEYIIKPSDGGSYQPLSISRSDGSLNLISETPITSPMEMTVIYGVVGAIRLLAGTYVFIITSRKQLGMHQGFPVFQIMSLKFLSCNKALMLSTAEEKRDEAYFVSLLKIVETSSGLYFSYQTDLTLNAQRLHNIAGLRKIPPLWKQADPRYLWNRSLIEELIEAKLEPYILPVIQGSFQTIQATLKESLVRVTLISRRCIRRIGTRMWRMGADLEGHVANFIETEQLLEVDGYIASYLQQGNEGPLSLAYADAVQSLKHIRYISFDFHHICGLVHFERLQLLYEQIAEDIKKQGYFLTNPAGEIVEEQKGIVRVNCIDSLDRTNVTQSFLGQKSFDSQLQQIGFFSSTECMLQHSDFHRQFKILWANHGDEISIQYSGTHALKGDLVRYGRQTVSGLIKDGFSALARYYLNNFHDGIRQDAMDLVAGHYTVSRGNPSPFHLNGFQSLVYLPVASVLIVGGFTVTTLSLHQATRGARHFLCSVVWAGVTAGVMAIVKANGRLFCSRPHLCKLY